MRRTWALVAAVVVMVGGVGAWAADGGGAALGSAEYKPSAERPVGWRGDGSGRFAGATPPTVWERRVKSFVSQMRCQGVKPADEAAAGMEMTVGEVNEWLIAGPYKVEKVTKELAESFVNDEANARPAEGEKAGELAWKAFTVTAGTQGDSYGRNFLDFAAAYGMIDKLAGQNKPGKIEPLIAYAHAYVWSPEAGKARLRLHVAGPIKAWLNGGAVSVPGQYAASPVVEVKKGWNDLMIKVGSGSGSWRVAAHFSPLPPYEYETKNILWMTAMPGGSWSSPTIVGERIFTTADNACLVCVNKADGKILWIRNNGSFESITEEEKKAPELAEIAAAAEKLEKVTDALVGTLNSVNPLHGLAAADEERVHKQTSEKGGLENKMISLLMKADKTRFKETRQHECQSTATPTSDGKYVYAAFLGSGKSDGAQTLVCYDLEGKKIWSNYLPANGAEHGCHSSPLLVADKVLFGTCGHVWAFDKATGKQVWTGGKGAKSWNEGSPLAGKIGDVDVAITPAGTVMRMADGKVLFGGGDGSGCASPILGEGMVLFNHNAFKWPGTLEGEVLKMDVLFKGGAKDFAVTPTGFASARIASPLAVEGLIYVVTEGGGLVVYDAKEGKVAYKRVLEALNPRLTWVFNVGVCSSPILAGKYIYITDDQSQTLVLEPGKEYKQVSRNVFQNLAPGGEQDQFESCPVAEGGRLYFRGGGSLYCVGEK